ncbi:MAG TPA: FG-GAP-like repeat-containing protein [Myxococcota bacterium]|nr:FG-GAP-like repeat-containing protein [Myxococcota bacterium]
MKSMMASLALLALVLSGCSDDSGEKQVCGDSRLVAPEACDDGNTAAGDGCSDLCVVEFCGDGTTNNTTEACDDGNTAAGDGCSATCVVEFCGDGATNNSTEACDDGNTAAGDGCSDLCVVEFCGDSVTNNSTEDCDDGNEVDGDGCDSTCQQTGCGSGVKTPGELCFDEVTSLTLGESPQGVVLADFNGDQHLDAAVSSGRTKVFVLFGDGTGALTPQAELTAAANFTSDIDSADFNKDGHADLVVASSDTSNPGKISVFLNSGTGTFTGPVSYDTQVFTRGFVIADLDGDDHLDLVVGTQNSSIIQRFFGDGQGAFTAAPNIELASPVSLIGGDLNKDGAIDLVVRQLGFSDFKILLNLNNDTGDFAEPVSVALDGPVGDIRAFDFDADGFLDLAVNVGGAPNQVVLYKGDGSTAFAKMGSFPVATDSTGLAIEDLDGDGKVELIQLEYTATSYYIFGGQGGFAFSDAQIFPATFPASFDVGDLNEDGLQDLVLANQGGTLRVSLFNP